MKLKKLNYIFVVLLLCNLCHSTVKSDELTNIISNDFKSFTNDVKNIGTVLNISHLLYSGGFIAADVCLMYADEDIRKFFQNNKSNVMDNYFQSANYFGEMYSAVGIPVGIYLSGLVFDNSEVRKTGRQMAEAMVLSAIITHGSKLILGRTRPFTENGAFNFQFFELNEPNISHPSGHTTVAFTIATVLSFNINKWWAYTGFYTLALSTGLARIYLDKHWASDVFMGAVIGTSSALLVLKASEKTEINNDNTGFSITPSINVINISYSF